MTKRNFNLRNVVAVAICLAGVVLFSNCKKDKDDEHIMGMTYHDNAVKLLKGWNLLLGNFTEGNSAPWVITGGAFTITDFDVTPGQDPNKNLKKGDTYKMNANGEFVFVLGRKASKDIAANFNVFCPPAHNTFNHTAGELNFWMKGTLVLNFKNGATYTFPNTYLAQGHSGASNNWWFGNDAMTNNTVQTKLFNPFNSSYVTYGGNPSAGCGYISPIEDPNMVFKFERGNDPLGPLPNEIVLVGVYKRHE